MNYNRRMTKRLINRSLQRIKHVVNNSGQGVNMQAAVTTTIIAVGIDNPLIANTTNVASRSRVKAIYMELKFSNRTAGSAPQTLYWNLQYNPQGSGSAVDPTNSGASNAKNYVFKSGQIAVTEGQPPGKVFGLIKVPNKYQRLMNGDVIQLNLRSFNNLANTDDYESHIIYKEIRG